MPRTGGNGYVASDGLCHSGALSTVTFNFLGLSVPRYHHLRRGLQHHGRRSKPNRRSGPYDSLNFALAATPPTVGSNPLPDTAYLETPNAGYYNDAARVEPAPSARTSTGPPIAVLSSSLGSRSNQIRRLFQSLPHCCLLGTGFLGLAILFMRRYRRASARAGN